MLFTPITAPPPPPPPSLSTLALVLSVHVMEIRRGVRPLPLLSLPVGEVNSSINTDLSGAFTSVFPPSAVTSAHLRLVNFDLASHPITCFGPIPAITVMRHIF